jgi:hypothetical protein
MPSLLHLSDERVNLLKVHHGKHNYQQNRRLECPHAATDESDKNSNREHEGKERAQEISCVPESHCVPDSLANKQ